MNTSDFDFVLPDHLIAQHPVEPRDHSRLMVVHRDSGAIDHRRFLDLPDYLRPGDTLVRNNTKVVPARLIGTRESTGGKWEGLFLRERPGTSWEILAKTRGHPQPGERILLDGGLALQLVTPEEGGRWIVRPEADGDTTALLVRHGHIPLPPYIRKGRENLEDRLRYQTVYASRAGAVAAPTAGLHFTPALLDVLESRGIAAVDLTLHVGIGTFRPIESERIDDHQLHAEWADLSEHTAAALNDRRGRGGRIVAVGTTSTRTLETSASDRHFRAFQGETSLYLKPGHVFQGVDALITNFHLPRSSLLVLVSAFAGFDLMRESYAQAISEGYRFYSYGDAMLIV